MAFMLLIFLCAGFTASASTLQEGKNAAEIVSAQIIPSAASSQEIPVKVTGLDVEIIWDESGAVRVGRDLPITVCVKSSGPAIDGYAAVYAPASQGEYYKMEESLSVSAGETAEAFFSIPVDYGTEMLLVEFRDADGTLYASEKLTLRPGYGYQELYVGAVSEEEDGLDVFDRLELSEYMGITTRLFPLSEESLPDRVEEYRLYDMILVENLEEITLSEQQLESLDNWVYEGGVAIIGNGGALSAAASEGEMVRERWGKGLYVYCVSPLGETAEGYGNEEQARNFLCDAIGRERLTALENSIQMGTEQYWNARNMTASVDPERLPQVWEYAVVLGVYILVLGPLLYAVLKKKGRQSMLRASMVVISLFFAGVIYLMGSRTRFTSPFMNYVSIQEIHGGTVRETAFINVSSPYNAAYSFRVNKSFDVAPVVSYDYQTGTFDPENNICQLAIRYGEEETEVEINDDIPFTAEYFRLSRSRDQVYGEGFSGEIHLFCGEVSGRLTNESETAFEKVCVYAGGFLIMAGDMEPGQQVDLSQVPVYSVPAYRQYEMVQAISGMNRFETATESVEASIAAWRNEVVSYYVNDTVSREDEDAVIFAFPAQETEEFLEGSDFDVRGVTLVTASMDVDYTRDGQVYVPILSQAPEVLQGSYDASNHSTYLQLLVLQYDFGDLLVDRILMEWPEEQEEDSYMRAFRGTMEFYNWETQSYDRIEAKEEYDREELEPYLSADNHLIVRYEDGAAEEYSYQTLLPVLSLVGRERP